ncbi:hypothetical protein ACQP2T_35315 [Nonomuraea sp. CA-143628]|uniref:hypothetical protein n=1 Tax=Nonomuraea sp. CA-143628 TaxID=3239997 RepID=UPI003D8E61B2
MARLGFLILVVGLGWVAAHLGDISGLEHSGAYLLLSGLLLAVGLYGSTHGIDLTEARRHKKLILLAVTVGVLLKATFMAGVVYLVSGDGRAVILAVAMAQIDPLSVASAMGDNRLSERARTILSAWSAFDDPVTVILGIYAVSFLRPAESGFTADYVVNLGLNALFAVVAYGVWRLVSKAPPLFGYLAAGIAVVSAAWSSLMLGLAISGLYLRMPDSRWLARAVAGAFVLSAFLMGLLLIGGANVAMGTLLGLTAFVAQMLAALVLTRGLPTTDRVHLGLAQQNGITAVILALTFERDFPGFVAVIAPSILTVNLLYVLANGIYDAWGPAPAVPVPRD